jgi:hypothetical protein
MTDHDAGFIELLFAAIAYPSFTVGTAFFVAHLIEKSGRFNTRDVLIAVTLTAIFFGGVARFFGQF